MGFDTGRGGLVCAACRPRGGGGVAAGGPVSPRALAVLRGLQGAAWEARLNARIAAPLEHEAASLLDAYVATLVGGPLRTSRFLAQMAGALPPRPAG